MHILSPMIPKVLYLYWGGGPLSFLRYLTVYSFRKFNPNWTIIVYYPVEDSGKAKTWSTDEQGKTYEGKNWFPELTKLGVRFEPMDMRLYGLNNAMPEVFKSGICRYYNLAMFGGVYCDFDIIFFKPLDIPKDVHSVFSYNTVDRYYSDGFIACTPDNELFKKVYHIVKSANGGGYQSRGPDAWNYNIPCPEGEGFWNIEMDLLYYYDSNFVKDIVEIGRKAAFPDESIGMHWYGGNPLTRDWEEWITPNSLDYDNILTQIVRRVYDKEGDYNASK